MEQLIAWALSLGGGAAGGAGAGALLKDKGLGAIGNLLAGAGGAALGNLGGISIFSLIPQLASLLGGAGSSLIGGGVNGLILTAIAGFVKSKMGSK